MTLYYALGLLLIFYLLLVGEFFIPSGGMIGVAAFVAAISALIIAFTHSVTAGFSVLTIILASTPAILVFMLRLWPHTPIGRRMLNRRPGQLTSSMSRTTSDGNPMGDLVGKTGTAKSDLLPSGLVIIDDQKLDAVSTGMPIDAGAEVVVVSIHAGKIQVRAAREEEIQAQEEGPSSPTTTGSALESLDLESLD